MRLRIVVPLVAGIAGLAGTAQAQSVDNDPWCAVYDYMTGPVCYYSNHEECAATVQNIGGICVRRSALGHGEGRAGPPR